MKLEDIGFYTLSDARAESSSAQSKMWRVEILLTGRCNFACPYCRKFDIPELTLEDCKGIIEPLLPIENIRFSGGEPTLMDYLPELIGWCEQVGVSRIALSTNGSAEQSLYQVLIDAGLNDTSVSLDACCASGFEQMSNRKNFTTVVDNIKFLSKNIYTTVGVVVTEQNKDELPKIIDFAHSLGVADIRIIPSAQYNQPLQAQSQLPHPILQYRLNNFRIGRHCRGIDERDSPRCGLVLDDMAVMGNNHFPCIIYLREGGKPIGKLNEHARQDRESWYKNHNSFSDAICSRNCLDVCVDFNNKKGVQ